MAWRLAAPNNYMNHFPNRLLQLFVISNSIHRYLITYSKSCALALFMHYLIIFDTGRFKWYRPFLSHGQHAISRIPAPYIYRIHDDVIKWKHFPRYWPFLRGIHRSPVNSPHKGQWRGALMFSLICARINGWVNNREAGDLRRLRAHYDVIVMYITWIRLELSIQLNNCGILTRYCAVELCHHWFSNTVGLRLMGCPAVTWTMSLIYCPLNS